MYYELYNTGQVWGQNARMNNDISGNNHNTFSDFTEATAAGISPTGMTGIKFPNNKYLSVRIRIEYGKLWDSTTDLFRST